MAQGERRADPTPAGRQRRPSGRVRKVAKVLAASVVALALVSGLSVALLYRHLNGNLNVEEFSSEELGPDRPVNVDVGGPHEPLDILVMGSDTREGAGNHLDGESGGGSDTTILFHLAADRQSAYGVSIPRDSLVNRPDCFTKDGAVIPGEPGAMWNEAFLVGGPACTQRQLEQLTGIRVDNYVVVDFNGFKDMVDAVGGVEVCVPEDLHSDKGDIDIPKGVHTLKDQQALDYIRIRYGVGDGTDLGRIKRQQAFIAALAEQVMDSGKLGRLDQLLGFLNAATKSLRTDIDNVKDLADIGLQVKDIGQSRVRFLTVPNKLSVEQEGRVEWLPEAKTLWGRIRLDQPLGSLRVGSIGVGDVSTTTGSPTANPTADPTTDPLGTASSPSGPVGADPEELEAAGLCA
jgi:LCP family protein required for cell wall assembly